MRFIGIDIGSEKHVFAVVDEQGQKVLTKATVFSEDAQGHAALLAALGDPAESLVAMEATGHYWRNLFVDLVAAGFQVALLNPLRTNRFGQEELERTKTDAVDAVSIARFAAQKRPTVTRLPDSTTEELRELVRFRDRLVQDMGDRIRQLHRLVDLGFPEFRRYVRTLDSELATAVLHDYPTAQAFTGVTPKVLARLRYDGRHHVGHELATQLIDAAQSSVGRHHGQAYRTQVRFICEDIDLLRRRLRDLERDIERTLDSHEVGKLLTTIDGVGAQTAARLIAAFGNPAEYKSGAALGSYVGAVPALKQSGKKTGQRAGITVLGNAELRSKLWMPTLTAARRNAWLRAYYERLLARGKPPKVALVAVMRKLLLVVYSVAKNRRPFEVRALASQGGVA